MVCHILFLNKLAPSQCQLSSLSLASRVVRFQKPCYKLERQSGDYNSKYARVGAIAQWVFLNSMAVQEIVECNAVSEEPSMPSRESESEDSGCDYAWQDQGHTIPTKTSGMMSVNCKLCFQQIADLLVYLCHCGYRYSCRICPTLEYFSKQPMETTILRIRIT